MLSNPKWSLNLDTLIAWLETKDPREAYDWNDRSGECLFGQFMRHIGIPWSYWSFAQKPECNYLIVQNAFGAEIGLGPKYQMKHKQQIYWTFGGALERARAAKVA